MPDLSIFDAGTLGENFGRVRPSVENAAIQQAAWVDLDWIFCLGLQGASGGHPSERLSYAEVAGNVFGNFALEDGMTLQVQANGGSIQEIVFIPSMFPTYDAFGHLQENIFNIGSATPLEVAAAINGVFIAARENSDSPARPAFVATEYGSLPFNSLRLTAIREGTEFASISVIGGTACAALGFDVPSSSEANTLWNFGLAPGDYSEVWQNIDLTDAHLVRAAMRSKLLNAAPTGLAWEFSILIDDVKYAKVQIREVRTRTRFDLAANVSKLAGGHKVAFRLQLAELTDFPWGIQDPGGN